MAKRCGFKGYPLSATFRHQQNACLYRRFAWHCEHDTWSGQKSERRLRHDTWSDQRLTWHNQEDTLSGQEGAWRNQRDTRSGQKGVRRNQRDTWPGKEFTGRRQRPARAGQKAKYNIQWNPSSRYHRHIGWLHRYS